MSTASQTGLVQWAGVVADQLALTPPPDDTNVSISLTNYTGNQTHPTLTGLQFGLTITTQYESYVTPFVCRLFGSSPATTDTFVSTDGLRETTSWSAGNVRLWWTRTVTTEVSA